MLEGNVGKGAKSMIFTPNLPTAGSYNVFIRSTNAPTRASNVPFDIVHGGGTAALSLDQRKGEGTWVLLGIYNFAAGAAGSVKNSTTSEGFRGVCEGSSEGSVVNN